MNNDTLIKINRLRHESYDDCEGELRTLEDKIVRDNYLSGVLRRYANQNLNLLIQCQTAPIPRTFKLACAQRYVWVPILYKLGKAQLASEISQSTFVYLFPDLHGRIQKKLDSLIEPYQNNQIQKILSMFLIESSDIQRLYSRIKTTNSIWKKIGSILSFENMTDEDFGNKIVDYLGFRWNMNIRKGENRYDSLVRGLQLLPEIDIIKFRDQQLVQNSGFSSEPVMKILFNLGGIPVELQILGGQVEEYMCAKGYSDYKTNVKFYPQKRDLTQDQWNARLGIILQQAEKNESMKNYLLMYKELMSDDVVYDEMNTFILDTDPSKKENRDYLASFVQRMA